VIDSQLIMLEGMTSTLERQKPYKPKIDEVIGDLLDGENLIRALEFIAYLKENKMNTRWANTNSWKIVNKGVTVGYIKAGVVRETAIGCYVKFKDAADPIKGSWTVTSEISGVGGGPRIDRVDLPVRIGYEEIVSNDEYTSIVLGRINELQQGNRDSLVVSAERGEIVIQANYAAMSSLYIRNFVEQPERRYVRFFRVGVFFDFDGVKCPAVLYEQVDFVPVPVAVEVQRQIQYPDIAVAFDYFANDEGFKKSSRHRAVFQNFHSIPTGEIRRKPRI